MKRTNKKFVLLSLLLLSMIGMKAQSYLFGTEFTEHELDSRRSQINYSTDDELSKQVSPVIGNIINKTVIIAQPYILANNRISGTPLVEYSGMLQVKLEPGFHAMAGCNFKANVKCDCEDFPESDFSNTAATNEEVFTESKNEPADPFEVSLTVFPNPFSSSMDVSFSLKEDMNVTLSVNNIYGQQVLKLEENSYKKGMYQKQFDLSKFSSGIYFLVLENDSFFKMQKLIKTE